MKRKTNDIAKKPRPRGFHGGGGTVVNAGHLPDEHGPRRHDASARINVKERRFGANAYGDDDDAVADHAVGDSVGGAAVGRVHAGGDVAVAADEDAVGVDLGGAVDEADRDANGGVAQYVGDLELSPQPNEVADAVALESTTSVGKVGLFPGAVVEIRAAKRNIIAGCAAPCAADVSWGVEAGDHDVASEDSGDDDDNSVDQRGTSWL